MHQIIDRRHSGRSKNIVNRRRFLERYQKQIKKAVADAISGRSIADIEKGEKISIPTRDIIEPVFGHGQGGKRESVHTGNREYDQGDRVERPKQKGGKGGKGKASDQGQGMDEFAFELSRDEFMDYFFDGLALPNLVRKKLASIDSFKTVRAGHSKQGVPTNINIVRSMKSAMGRRIALRAPYTEEIVGLEKELEELLQQVEESDFRVVELRERIALLRKKIKRIPFLDTIDLRFNNFIKEPVPTTAAVMFCVMDISGSMGQDKKDMAKRFFMLLYLFLTRNYKKIQVVFIAHHTAAKEVDEQEFFYSRETGGTIVSSALVLLQEIIETRYPTTDWNVYVAQASDGDDWNDDPIKCRKLLSDRLLSLVQYFAYIEITEERPQNLWREYLSLENDHDNFAMQRIEKPEDIYPVFRELFKKQLA